MREIEFRAKVAGADRWIYGLPHKVYVQNEIDSIQEVNCTVEYIAVDTLGQFTGLKDKSGVKIYEGDVVSFDIETDDEFGGVFIGVVSYISELAGYIIQSESNGYTLNSDVEIIGNIHENKELLKQ